MSSETWQEIVELVALLPWIAFVVAIVWCEVLVLRDKARTAQATSERARPDPGSGSSAGRTTS